VARFLLRKSQTATAEEISIREVNAMDTEKFPKSDSPESTKSREGTSRRKLLIAGAAALPVMVTIKSTSVNAAGLTAIPVGGRGGNHDGDHDGGGGGGYPDQTGVLGSIACIQNFEMPWSCDDATKHVCEKKNLDYDGWCDREHRRHSSLQDGSVMPANFQLTGGGGYGGGGYGGGGGGYGGGYDSHRDNDDKCRQVNDYFKDDGRDFWPGCTFNVGKERHCTYVQICLSTACWNSISTALDIQKSGTDKYWS
jgi:hypothetical protein